MKGCLDFLILLSLAGCLRIGPLNKKENYEKEYANYYSKLLLLADVNPDGNLSNFELYQMKVAMGIQDSSINYVPELWQVKEGIRFYEEYLP